MFLGNEETEYILDKAEGNAVQINGHPAWGSNGSSLFFSVALVVRTDGCNRDIATHQSIPMDVPSNSFCASGMPLPNASYVTFGGNGANGPDGATGTVLYPGGGPNAFFDAIYGDYDGSKSICVLNPCTNADNFSSPNCQWFDNASIIAMAKDRWYSGAEALANGTVVLVGGFVSGGYINRHYPNIDPTTEGGKAEPTYEFYPSNEQAPQTLQFMIRTSGLNSYVYTFLLASGKMFLQANVSAGKY
jgi:hypothetical protein